MFSDSLKDKFPDSDSQDKEYEQEDVVFGISSSSALLHRRVVSDTGGHRASYCALAQLTLFILQFQVLFF